ncbi:hypothetical protein A1OO_05615 [Enterovibrio norvegicus FF-33]|uniref:hypothetical protein n=1 Tax=Enterovibrio norvegicus TaxID=188144 RepID=UPI0003038240|nr:hypothetical protein [Enterovibrio norvegicus]OEE70250.1 hypothetical protein A1OO_05615 [Enterovibrio norvegicus FF-33]
MLSKQHNAVTMYVLAKDNNKPHLMRNVFTEEAVLSMKVDSSNIAFPPRTEGLEKITDTLCRDFNANNENIYTFCLTDTLKQTKDSLHCGWLVGMKNKTSGEIKVGFGDYAWCFDNNTPGGAKQLTIEIHDMSVLPNDVESTLFDWLAKLPYPWVSHSDVLGTMPAALSSTAISMHLAGLRVGHQSGC